MERQNNDSRVESCPFCAIIITEARSMTMASTTPLSRLSPASSNDDERTPTPLVVRDGDEEMAENDEESTFLTRNASPSPAVDQVMVASLCAAFSDWAPIVHLPPAIQRHSSRWRLFLLIVIVLMTFSASFAHLRYMMMLHGKERRVAGRRRRRRRVADLQQLPENTFSLQSLERHITSARKG